MQIESIVEAVENEEMTEKSVTQDPIVETVEKNDKNRMKSQLISLVTQPEEYDQFTEKSVKADPIGDAIKKVI